MKKLKVLKGFLKKRGFQVELNKLSLIIKEAQDDDFVKVGYMFYLAIDDYTENNSKHPLYNGSSSLYDILSHLDYEHLDDFNDSHGDALVRRIETLNAGNKYVTITNNLEDPNDFKSLKNTKVDANFVEGEVGVMIIRQEAPLDYILEQDSNGGQQGDSGAPDGDDGADAEEPSSEASAGLYGFPLEAGKANSRITSKVGPRGKENKPHKGLDLVPDNTMDKSNAKVVSIADGYALRSYNSTSFGQSVYIYHDSPETGSAGTYSIYAHLKKGSRQVKVGDRVLEGDELGIMGDTGNSDGAHLHLEIRNMSQSEVDEYSAPEHIKTMNDGVEKPSLDNVPGTYKDFGFDIFK